MSTDKHGCWWAPWRESKEKLEYNTSRWVEREYRAGRGTDFSLCCNCSTWCSCQHRLERKVMWACYFCVESFRCRALRNFHERHCKQRTFWPWLKRWISTLIELIEEDTDLRRINR